MERPDLTSCSEKEASKYYWFAFAERCLKCKNKCKQSHLAQQVVCPRFDKKED